MLVSTVIIRADVGSLNFDKNTLVEFEKSNIFVAYYILFYKYGERKFQDIYH